VSDTATKPPKTRKPNVGSDPTKGSRVKQWQIGVYAFAITTSATMLGISLLYILSGSFSRLFTAAAVLVTGLSWGLLTSKNDSFTEPEGIKIADSEPVLRDFVYEVAAQVDAPVPDEIYLVTTADFGVTEATRFFGRTVDRSVLTIGLPFLQALTKQEFAALLAHELAHYADNGIEEGVRAHRSLRAARELIAVERDGFINGVYGSYARKMFRSVGGVGVAQEEAADRAATEAYGTQALLSVLGKYDDVAVAFDQLLREYVVPALQQQMHPNDLFGGFGELLKSANRADERARDVERRRNKNRNEFELHLTPPERIAMVQTWSTESGIADLHNPQAPAHTLLDDDARSADTAVGSWASKLMTNRTEPQTWQHLTDEVYSVKTQSLASMVFDDETDPVAHLEQAFAWSETQDWARVDGPIEACLKSMKDPDERRTKWARCIVVEAAAATGSFAWQHSWDGPPVLVDTAGTSLDAMEIASLIVHGKSTEARTAFQAATS
jgi:hypothetical protein